MRGADEMRDRLVTLVQQAAPPKIALLRQAWDYTTEQLPDIDLVSSGETVENVLNAAVASNTVIVINPRLLTTDQVDIDPYGQPVYNCRYSCRIYVWAYGENWDKAKTARDHLAVVVRLCLLEWPNLTYNMIGNTNFRLHRNTYTEEFGEPHRITNRAGGRVWAPALLSVDVDREDDMHDGSLHPPLGTAHTLTPAAQNVGPDQPLPGA
jgi:hypothetical protein